MHLLAESWPPWAARPRAVQGDPLYVAIAELGHAICQALREGEAGDLVPFFDALERAFEGGDAEALNLLGAGLFEAMQGDAYRLFEPADQLDDWLGPRALAAWRDLIEGWTGRGVRSITSWRRVAVNGRIKSARREATGGAIAIWRVGRADEPGARGGWYPDGGRFAAETWPLDALEAERFFGGLSPLVAERVIGDIDAATAAMGLETPAAIVKLNLVHRAQTLRVGALTGEGPAIRYVADDWKVWALDAGPLLADWSGGRAP